MKIEIRERPDRPAERRFEAIALVPDLPGAHDKHAVGATAQEAEARLREYVASIRAALPR